MQIRDSWVRIPPRPFEVFILELPNKQELAIKPSKPPITINPFASHVHIYILAIGIFAGIILGPGVLGKVAPSTYRAMFATAQSRQISKIESSLKKQTKKELSHIKDTKLTLNELKHKLSTNDKKLASLRQAITQAHDRRAVHLVIALLLAIIVVMLIETLLVPVDTKSTTKNSVVVPPILGRLITIRYALIAGSIMVILSRPGLLGSSVMLLAIIIIALVLILGVMPFGKMTNS